MLGEDDSYQLLSAMAPSFPNEVPRPSGWKYLGWIVAGMLMLGIGSGVWWYYDNGDLIAVRQRAKELGIPVTWQETGVVISSSDRLHNWARAAVLSKQAGSYQGIPSATRKGAPEYKLWDPIPDEMRQHHESLSKETVGELMAVLDSLGPERLTLRNQSTINTRLHEIGELRAIMQLLNERILLADDAQLMAETRRALHCIRRFADDILVLHMVRCSVFTATLNAIAYRLADLKRLNANVSQDLSAITENLQADLVRSMNGEFIQLYTSLEQREFTERSWLMPLVIRAGRQFALMKHLDAISTIRSVDLLEALAWAKVEEKLVFDAYHGFPYPGIMLLELYMPSWSTVLATNHRTILHGRLLIAELQGHAWPVDSFDLSGSRLRQIIRDGRIIAAYTVDVDGTDHGGDAKKDRVFPLYAKP